MIKLTIILIVIIFLLLSGLTIATIIGRLSYLNKKVLYSEGLIEENISKKITSFYKYI